MVRMAVVDAHQLKVPSLGVALGRPIRIRRDGKAPLLGPARAVGHRHGFQGFWSKVRPLIPEALGYLELTIEGRQWIANLYNNLFQSEHRQSFFGPFPGAS